MKFPSLIFIVFVVSVSLSVAEHTEEMKAQVMKMFTDCKASTGASDGDIAKIMSHVKPTTHEEMCLFSCVMEKMGIFKDGKFYKEGMEAWAKAMGAPENLCDTVLAECSSSTHSDPCNAASEMGYCFQQTAIKHGVKF